MKMGRAFAAAGCALLGFTLVAAAQEPPAGDGTGRHRAGREQRRGGRLAEYLGLDAQQKAAVQKVHQQQREEMKPVMEEGRALRKRLREAVEAASPDATAVGEATLALEAHRQKARAQREAFRQKLEGLLDPAQKEKLKAFESGRRTGMGRDGRRGHRLHRRPPQAPPVEG